VLSDRQTEDVVLGRKRKAVAKDVLASALHHSPYDLHSGVGRDCNLLFELEVPECALVHRGNRFCDNKSAQDPAIAGDCASTYGYRRPSMPPAQV
jgi:hypothetical protein